MDQNRDICAQNTKLMLETLESIGFTINKKIYVCFPCQKIIFFGFVVDSVLFMVYLTKEKLMFL